MERIKICAYARVSTNSKDQANSYANQKDYFEDVLGKNPKYELVGIYADKGLSGVSLKKRDEFNKMIYDAGVDIDTKNGETVYSTNNARKPLFQQIFVKNTSRFARNVMVIDILRKLLQKGVTVYFKDIDLLFDGQDKEFMLNLFLNFDQQESVDKSKKVKFGMERSAKNKVIKAKDDFYGYKYLIEKNELEIVPEEAEVIKKMYELYVDGNGFRKIRDWLRENGIKRKGKDFCQTSINRILKNMAYTGRLVRNKTQNASLFAKSTHRIENDPSQWIVHEDRIPRIISDELFYKAKEIRESKTNYQNRKGVKTQTGKYAGFVFCSKCGAPYVKNRDAKTGRDYLNCRTKKTQGTKVCKSPNVTISLLDKAIEVFSKDNLYKVIVENKIEYIMQLEMFRNKLLEKIDAQKHDEAITIKEKLDELEERKKRTAKLYTLGNFDEATLSELLNEIESEYKRLNDEYQKLTMSNDEIYNEIKEVDNVIAELGKFEIGKEYTNQDLLSMLDCIKVREVDFVDNIEKKTTIFLFAFKVFKNLNDIVKKYADQDIVLLETEILVIAE